MTITKRSSASYRDTDGSRRGTAPAGSRICLAVLALGFLASCGEDKPARQAVSGPPAAVQAAAVTEEEWPETYEATGTVRARTTAVISSKVMGYVREVKVQAGDHVRHGQPLVVIDSRDLDAHYRQAEAARNEAWSAVPEAESAMAAAKANLELAQVTFQRMKVLFDKKSISNQEFDEASARLKAAEAGYEMAKSKREQLQAKIRQAEEAVQAAGIMRSYADITAPFDGTVIDKRVDPGDLAAPGVPLLTIERAGAFRLEAAVAESRLAQIRAGQPATVLLDALDRKIEGRVSEVVPAVDAASRAYLVKIDLPPLAQLRSGIFGRAVFRLGVRRVLAVPAEAVVERGQLQSVVVAEAGVARTRLVTLGRTDRGRREVLSGLKTGERVIVPVPPGLADGARVEVRP